MHAHERVDPRRGPKRERDDGRREIDAGVSEYEEDREDREAREASLYDSSDDWGFNWADDFPDDEDHLEDYPMDDAHDFDDAHINARVENNRIVIEVPIPAGTSPERWGKIVEDLTRRITVKRTAGGCRIHDVSDPEIQEGLQPFHGKDEDL